MGRVLYRVVPPVVITIAFILAVYPSRTAAQPAAPTLQERQELNRVYGERIRQVTATKEHADNIALAEDLLIEAQAPNTVPSRAALYCETAFNLARVSPDGYGVCERAMDLASVHAPVNAKNNQQAVLGLYQALLAKAKGPEKSTVAQRMVGLLLRYGEMSDSELAKTHYSRAVVVARQAGLSPDEPQARLDRIATEERLRPKIAELTKKLAANPTDEAVSKELVAIHVLELNDVKTAERWAAAADHPMLAVAGLPIAPLEPSGTAPATNPSPSPTQPATRPSPSNLLRVPPADLLTLAKWYDSLVIGAPPDRRLIALERALRLESLYLALYRTDDDSRKAVATSLAARSQLVSKSSRPKGATSLPCQWHDILKYADPKTHTFDTNSAGIVREGTAIIVKSDPRYKGYAAIHIPVDPQGCYHFRLRYRIQDSDLRLFVPRRGKGAWITGTANTGKLEIEKVSAGPPSAFSTDGEHVLDVWVFERPSDTRIIVDLDGKPYHAWTVGDPALQLIKPPVTLAVGGSSAVKKRSFTVIAAEILPLEGRMSLVAP